MQQGCWSGWHTIRQSRIAGYIGQEAWKACTDQVCLAFLNSSRLKFVVWTQYKVCITSWFFSSWKNTTNSHRCHLAPSHFFTSWQCRARGWLLPPEHQLSTVSAANVGHWYCRGTALDDASHQLGDSQKNQPTNQTNNPWDSISCLPQETESSIPVQCHHRRHQLLFQGCSRAVDSQPQLSSCSQTREHSRCWISKTYCKQCQPKCINKTQREVTAVPTTRSHQRLTKDKSKKEPPAPKFLPSAPPFNMKVSITSKIKAFVSIVSSAVKTTHGPLPWWSCIKATPGPHTTGPRALCAFVSALQLSAVWSICKVPLLKEGVQQGSLASVLSQRLHHMNTVEGYFQQFLWRLRKPSQLGFQALGIALLKWMFIVQLVMLFQNSCPCRAL